MTTEESNDDHLPLVSVAFLAYNRREELLVSLRNMVAASGYPREQLEVIVIDNASTDGTVDAVRSAFPSVRIIANDRNVGAPGWNRGFAAARGDYVLILDDDAYLRPGGLERAVRAAVAEHADLVSFSVVSASDEDHRLNDDWQTGLLSYWGCAALVSAPALRALGGYDPNIFIWANEVEFTMRLLDGGFRHLYLPDVYAIHMKKRIVEFDRRRYLVNARHHGYIAGKLMRGPDAAATVWHVAQQAVIDSLVHDPMAAAAAKEVLVGLAMGLRHRHPVRPVVSAAYRRNFRPFAAPWQFVRSPLQRVSPGRDRSTADRQRADRHVRYFSERAVFYPPDQASLQL
jgi:GT2 family glycosyltransferase